jgi:hypothetical protein
MIRNMYALPMNSDKYSNNYNHLLLMVGLEGLFEEGCTVDEEKSSIVPVVCVAVKLVVLGPE